MTATRDSSASAARQAGEVSPQVLVVDDEPSVRKILVRMLKDEGFGVYEAGDGREALETIRAAPDRFDVVVSDVVMPRINGLELVQALSTVCPDLPCILISGYGGSHLAGLGLTPPCGVLPKPVAQETLSAEVRRCLRPRRE